MYFDASALVKLVVDEEGSDLAAELWDGCDAAVASRLAFAEVCAALAAANRNHELTDIDLVAALDEWEVFWAAVRPVRLTAAVTQRAGRLARHHALRGADAIHLASALALDDTEMVVAVWDKRLAKAAITAHLAVAPAVGPDVPEPGT